METRKALCILQLFPMSRRFERRRRWTMATVRIVVGRRSRTNEKVEREEEINSRTHGGAEIGPQSLHGLRTIAVGIASLCALFLPSVLLFCTFSGSFLRSSSHSIFLPFTLFLAVLSDHLLRVVSIVTALVAFSNQWLLPYVM